MVNRPLAAFLCLVVLSPVTGCGYTTKTLLPENVHTVTVLPVKNAIDLSAEISDKDHFRVYRPGLEVDVTNAMINRFIFDGNLKVVKPDKADLVVEAKLIDYRRDVLRYNAGNEVEEYRLNVVLDVAVYQASDKKELWHESNLVGDTTSFVTGRRAVNEDEAVAKAVEDVARRVVEKTVELW